MTEYFNFFKNNGLSKGKVLDLAWASYNSCHRCHTLSKQKAQTLLQRNLMISRHQPAHIIDEKIRFLMTLRKNNPNRMTLPNVYELPADENIQALNKINLINRSCVSTLYDLHEFSLPNDTRVTTFIDDTINNLDKINVLEVMEQERIKLANILYGLRVDPLVKALKAEIDLFIESFVADFLDGASIEQKKAELTAIAVKLIHCIPLEARAIHYKEKPNIDAFIASFREHSNNIINSNAPLETRRFLYS